MWFNVGYWVLTRPEYFQFNRIVCNSCRQNMKRRAPFIHHIDSVGKRKRNVEVNIMWSKWSNAPTIENDSEPDKKWTLCVRIFSTFYGWNKHNSEIFTTSLVWRSDFWSFPDSLFSRLVGCFCFNASHFFYGIRWLLHSFHILTKNDPI